MPAGRFVEFQDSLVRQQVIRYPAHELIALGRGGDRFEAEWQVHGVVGRNENFSLEQAFIQASKLLLWCLFLFNISGLTWSDPDCPNCKT